MSALQRLAAITDATAAIMIEPIQGEGGVRVAASVVAEDVLVQIRLQVIRRCPSVGAVQPRLEVGDRTMRTRQVWLPADAGALVTRPVLEAQPSVYRGVAGCPSGS